MNTNTATEDRLNLELKRFYFGETFTIGKLFIDSKFHCYILEDVDRGMDYLMPLPELQKRKVHSKTAIPTGVYQIVITYSPRFKKYLPLLLNVPAYVGIRIHPGNDSTHTDGCLLPGTWTMDTPNKVLNSRSTFASLLRILKLEEKRKKIVISITRERSDIPDKV